MTDEVEDFKFNVHELRENCPSVKAINQEIAVALREIKLKMKEAHKNKMRTETYIFKTNYNIPNMSNADAQTKIFATVIKKLDDENIITQLNFDKTGHAYLMFKWETPADEEQKIKDEEIIKQALSRYKATLHLKQKPVATHT